MSKTQAKYFKRGDVVRHKLDGRVMVILDLQYFLPAKPQYHSYAKVRKARDVAYKAAVKKATEAPVGYECRLKDNVQQMYFTEKFFHDELIAVTSK